MGDGLTAGVSTGVSAASVAVASMTNWAVDVAAGLAVANWVGSGALRQAERRRAQNTAQKNRFRLFIDRNEVDLNIRFTWGKIISSNEPLWQYKISAAPTTSLTVHSFPNKLQNKRILNLKGNDRL
jgi:hypothetical protein